MKFLQVHYFYDDYLEAFYRDRHELAGQSHETQLSALLADGFCGVHLIAPYMEQAGWEGRLAIVNCQPAQLAWRRENGLEAEPFPGWTRDTLRQQIAAFRPDVLYLTEPILLDSRFVASLAHRPKLVVGWRAADIPESVDWSGFDLMLSSLTGVRREALARGAASAEPFWPGFPEWIAPTLEQVALRDDVVFVGRWTRGQHPARNRLLHEVAKAAERDGFSCAMYLSGELEDLPPVVERCNRGPVYGGAMHRALAAGRIAIDARGDLRAGGIDLAGRETGNMRLIEATGCGAFLLTEVRDNLGQLFRPGLEIETYRNSSELIAKIRYYLDHPEEREAVARRGTRRCREAHAMGRRVEQLDALLRDKLAPLQPIGD